MISDWNDIDLLRVMGGSRLAGRRRAAFVVRSRRPRGLGGCADVLDVPGPVLLHDGERIAHLELGRGPALGDLTRCGPGRNAPDDGRNDIASRAARRDADGSYRVIVH